ncbi:MAG: CoB--CoM heterodisulfide reductase iron-sulfur subunit B family protein [Deltaproteobacteria bacterium]|nr:CoB--CoM heterodisulfide reductase iron-sulfur subunit B family protein [Deltaproteobacteria bacterium]
MKYYSYYPGCSAEATATPLGLSVLPVARALDIDLVELEDWNCCGSTPYNSVNKLEAGAMAARNLALAEKTGLDLVTPCSNCYVVLTSVNTHLKELPDFREKVNEALAAGNLTYDGGVKVRHLAEVLYTDITPEGISSKVTNPLEGLKVASYYGCQLVRPNGFDDPESPHSLDELVASLGAEAVPWELKARCCGSSLIMPEPNVALGLINKLLKNAQERGAQCLVTPCPLCQINLDAYQSQVNSKFNTSYNLPVLFVTQLIGVALGIPAKELALSKNIVSPMGVLAPYL